MSVPNTAETRQYLTYTLGEEVFAFDIAKVREVLDCGVITKVPGAPEFLRGVINLRGSVVPVVDLRLKCGMTRTEKTGSTCIIIVDIIVENEAVIVGALADSVQEVLDLGGDQIEPAPRIGTTLKIEFIKGMGKRGNSFVIILNIDKVFTPDELAVVQAGQTGMDGEER